MPIRKEIEASNGSLWHVVCNTHITNLFDQKMQAKQADKKVERQET